MGYYNNPEWMIHTASNQDKDINLKLIDYLMNCVCSKKGRPLKDVASDLGICVIHDYNTGYMGKEEMPDRDLVANKLMEYAKENGEEISRDAALNLTDTTIYNHGRSGDIFEHYTALIPNYAELKGAWNFLTAIDSRYPIIEELLRRGVPVDINRACEISPEKGISNQNVDPTKGPITTGIIDTPSEELKTMLSSDLGEMLNEASEDPDTITTGRIIK